MQFTAVRDRLLQEGPPSGPIAVRHRRHVQHLYSTQQIEMVLRRERARSDRNQTTFTAVRLTMRDPHATQRDCWRLAAVLLRILRETDELGWFDERTLCAILPDTSSDGAAIFTARVDAATAGKSYAPDYSIFIYPERADGSSTAPRAASADRIAAAGGLVAKVTSAFDLDLQAKPNLPLAPMLAEPLPLWKRTIDVVVALGAIVASAPLWLFAIAAVRFSSPGPIFFLQKRTGLGGRPFMIWKFRTMVVDAERKQLALRAMSEQDGPAFKLKNDPRIFPAGHLLRKTSIDELPQLINVLRGEMTLVGPRPLPVHEADACVGWQSRRHDVTPGLTCIWQVEGRSRVKFEEWMRMDRRYARKRGLLGDVFLVLKTIPAVLLRRGAN